MEKRWLNALMVLIAFSLSVSAVSAACVDVDGDGYGEYDDASCPLRGDDCMDSAASINPGATEACNDYLDNNCNGYIDEEAACTSKVCGNQRCDTGETPESCSRDCPAGGGTTDEGTLGGEESADICGDFQCGISEDDITCPRDCKDFSSCNINLAEMYNSNNVLINYSNVGSTVKIIANIENPDGPLSECNEMPISFWILEIDNLEDNEPSEVVTLYANTTDGKAEFSWVAPTIEDTDDDPNQNGFEQNAAELVMLGYYSRDTNVIYYPVRFVKIFPEGFTPSTSQQSSGSYSGDVQQAFATETCGDNICGATETVASCPADCTVAEDDTPPGLCAISGVSWADETGASFDKIKEGSKVTLSADVTGCDSSSIQFIFLEYDVQYDTEDGAPCDDDLLPASLEATVSDGKAAADWTAAYMDDEPDPTTGDTYPEFILIAYDATDPNAQSPATFQSETAFVVYKEGEVAPENVDTSVSDFTTDVGEQAGTIGGQYRAGAGRQPTASDTGEEAEPACGDGTCDLTEDAEICPDDCAEKSSFKLIIIIVFVLLLVGGGVGFFLWRRRRNKVAEAAKKADEQKKAAQQAKPAQPQTMQVQAAQPSQAKPAQPVQQAKPAQQPNGPFANEEQVKATLNFIKTARSQGLSDEKIKEMLKNGNYNPQQIEYAFANMK